MTLILTAVCRDGIAICADKRRTEKSGQKTEFFDDLDKIYRFADASTVAFNHGINRLRGKDWRSCLSDFEAAFDCGQLAFDELLEEFYTFIAGRVIAELNHNVHDHVVGFVFCTVGQGVAPAVRELCSQKGRPFEDVRHSPPPCSVIRTGEGAQYLEEYLADHPEVNTVDYWQNYEVCDGLSRLSELFKEACRRRKQESGEEFSDTYRTEMIKESTSESS